MRCRRNIKASSLAEYAIVIGIIAAALVTMNTYIKRAVQGKTRDLTDAFIGKEQAGKLIRKDVVSWSNTTYNSTSRADVSGLLGGGFNAGVDQSDEIRSKSGSGDYAGIAGYGSVVPAEAGTPVAPVQPKPTSDPPAS